MELVERMQKSLKVAQKATCFWNGPPEDCCFRNGPEDHVDLVERMQKSLKVAQKTVSSLLKELAVEEAQRLKQADPLVSGSE